MIESTGAEPFLPLSNAAAGEWARYAALDARAIRYEIIEVTPTTVETQVTVYDHGKPLSLPAIRRDARDADLLARQARTAGAKRSQHREAVEAAGRRWDAVLYEDRWTDEDVSYVRRTWISPDAPVFGVICMELHGDHELEARLELTGMSQPD